MIVRKNLWTAIIILTGGLAGLLLSMSDLTMNYVSFVKISFAVMGIFAEFFFFHTLTVVNSQIQELLNKLGDGI